MKFDARTAKSLEPGQHITFPGYPGLRLSASATVRTWIYRYKSPVDGRMRQIAIGRWPTLSFPAAIVAWESLKNQRD
ncbi:MAG: Arm DNA-binding domain-containing protein, partial [Methylococcaceae bacterium]|nr:Arm DNA-binding domain-containing protein [Methylococcaceae bacterium]